MKLRRWAVRTPSGTVDRFFFRWSAEFAVEFCNAWARHYGDSMRWAFLGKGGLERD